MAGGIGFCTYVQHVMSVSRDFAMVQQVHNCRPPSTRIVPRTFCIVPTVQPILSDWYLFCTTVHAQTAAILISPAAVNWSKKMGYEIAKFLLQTKQTISD